MLSVVIHPGWLLLLVCSFVLLLVGCTSFTPRTPTQVSTSPPLVTLQVLNFATETPQPRSTQPSDDTIPPSRTPDWMISRTRSSQPPAHLSIIQPVCYDAPNKHFICLGQILNHSAQTIENITVHITLLGNHNQLLQEQVIAVEQRTIVPQGSAPFRAILPYEYQEEMQIIAEVANYTARPPGSQILIIEDSSGMLDESGRYRGTAIIHNLDEEALSVQLVVTLLNQQHEVIGYRTQQIEETLPAHTKTSLQVDVMPLTTDDGIYGVFFIEPLHSSSTPK